MLNPLASRRRGCIRRGRLVLAAVVCTLGSVGCSGSEDDPAASPTSTGSIGSSGATGSSSSALPAASGPTGGTGSAGLSAPLASGPAIGPPVAMGPSAAGASGSPAAGLPTSSGVSGTAAGLTTAPRPSAAEPEGETTATAGVLRVSTERRDLDEPRPGGLPEGVEDLEQAECYDPTPDPTQRAVVALVLPCEGPHLYEVYSVVQSSDGPYAEFPGDGKLREFAESSCYQSFSTFVGTEWKRSNLDIETFYPTASSWRRERDRKITCSLYDRKFKDLIGTAQGSAY